jgi:acyl-CoA synthetase (NDP forming)
MACSRQAGQIYRHAELRRLVEPQVVAVVGASTRAGSFGRRTLDNLGRYGGRTYAVNVKHQGDLGGVPCFPTVRDLPETPDCAILAVGADLIPQVLEECAERGVGGAIVYASGFAELGTAEGLASQERIAAIGRAGGMPIVGPNSIGLVNTRLGAGMLFIPGFAQMKLIDGPVSIVSQGGGFGYALMQGMERGIGIGHFLSPGNSADVDICDFIAYLAEDPQVGAIATASASCRRPSSLVTTASPWSSTRSAAAKPQGRRRCRTRAPWSARRRPSRPRSSVPT